jgi:phosphoribosyl 1,2-cyclic phosphate phosphodiesterase
MMDFLFLGTGPAEAIPRTGHSDPLCKDAMRPRSKSRRLRSSGLLKSGKTSILIDAGPDIAYQLTTHRVDRIDACFLTHAHLDAAGGVKELDAWARRRGTVIPVYTERATERRYGKFGHLEHRFVSAGGVEKIGSISARFFRVRHSLNPGFPTLGFRIGKFAYASDVSNIPTPSLRMLQGVSTVILDSAFWFDTNFRGHMKPDEAIKYARWLGAERLYLTQTGHTYPPHDEAEHRVRAFAKTHAPGLEVAIAYDGLHLKL